tara:strand:+ start:425 stop:1897 length:1473 start_codon:yes stop_codon:yes gene_type:complete
MISKISPDRILTKRGYAIVKDDFDFKTLQKCRHELNVKPFVNNDYGEVAKPYPIYLESKKKLYLPKFYGLENFGNPELIKMSKGKSIDVAFSGSLRKPQEPVIAAFMHTCKKGPLVEKSNGGIISVPCGWGKTIMALYLISKLKRKTIIVVHKEFLLNQWKERIQEFLPSARVGLIQGPKIDIENKDIVLAMLQSLSIKTYDNKIFNDFGFSIVDECHHIAAEVFSRALHKINTFYSLGLSATPNRIDGLTKVFKMFLGPIVYKIDKDNKCVEVRVIEYNEPHNKIYTKEELTFTQKLCLPRMINNIASNNNRNALIIGLCKTLLKANKQTIILSDRRKQLTYLYGKLSEFTSVGYYVGGMKQKALKESEGCSIILGTYPMSSEGLDIPTLDALIFATPKSNIQQSIGRITRKKHKTDPIAYDIVDKFCMFPNQYKKRERLYKKLQYKVFKTTIFVKCEVTDKLIENSLINLKEFCFGKKKKQKCLIMGN